MRVGAARRRVRLPERLHIGGRAGNTRLQHRPVGPRGELAREAGIAVHRQRGLDLARFDQHVAEVQEESLEVVRRDPRVPANALRPLPRLEPHVARVVRVRAVDPLGDADVEVAPLLLERVAVAFGVDRLGRGGVAGGEQVELGPRRHRVLHREVAAAHHLLVLVDGAFRHQQARVEAQVPRFLGIEAHRLLEVLAREHRVVGDLGADRLVPRPLAEPPDVHPPDVRSGDRVVGCGDVRGLERGERGRDAVVGSAVQRGPRSYTTSWWRLRSDCPARPGAWWPACITARGSSACSLTAVPIWSSSGCATASRPRAARSSRPGWLARPGRCWPACPAGAPRGARARPSPR